MYWWFVENEGLFNIYRNFVFRIVIIIAQLWAESPVDNYKILTGRKDLCLLTLLINYKLLFQTGTAKKPHYLDPQK